MNSWHQQTLKKTIEILNTNLDTGLTSAKARRLYRQYGKNALPPATTVRPFTLFLRQFKDILIIILLAAAAVSYAIALAEGHGSLKETVLILTVVIAIALVGFFNEFKAEKTIEALNKLVDYNARVIRNGQTVKISSQQLVPGDVILLETGQKVPADIRLAQSSQLIVNEASLTGESTPVTKDSKTITTSRALGDQRNMLFSGTYITAGSGRGIVVATGHDTEIGKIATLVNNAEAEPTPMQLKLDDLGKRLGYVIGGICVGVFIIVFFFVASARQLSLTEHIIFAFTAAVALAVAAIPEGLAFVVRISLALGARRMAGRNALVRKLSAVEALGSTDIICTDKTGTLTKGEMTVRNLFVNNKDVVITSGVTNTNKQEQPSQSLLLKVGVLCNNAAIENGKVVGDSTEGALLFSAIRYNNQALSEATQLKRTLEIPFSAERKMMSTVHVLKNGRYFVASKGAPEILLELCSHYLDERGHKQLLTSSYKQRIQAKNKSYAKNAMRVLGFAYKETDQQPTNKNSENNLIFVGLQAIMDPPRAEVADAIGKIQSEAGIKVIMITGDFIETAKAIAKEIGISGEAVTGDQLDKMSESEFIDRVETIAIYARVNPEHKIRIVQALKRRGHQVAMTGDGVNDAPAIKAANIGIAMGVTGTDVAKEAADLILLDDHFLTIISAIEEGRGIFRNVRKFVNFLISCNIAEVITILLGVLLFHNLMLTAAQLLFINIVTDGLPAIALGSDKVRHNILSMPPKRFQQAIISKRIWAEIIIFGSLMSLLLVWQYWHNSKISGVAAASSVFAAMVVYEFVRLIDIRSDYKVKRFSNPWLTVSIIVSLAIQLLVLYVKPLADIFYVGPLSRHDWIIMLAGAAILFIIMKLANPLLSRLMPGSEPA